MKRWGNARAISGAALVLVLVFISTTAFAVIPDTDLSYLTASSSDPGSHSTGVSVVRPFFTVLIFGGILFGGLYYAYRTRTRERSSELIHVLASSPISQGVVVQIVDVAGVLYVVSVSRNGPILLGQITEREKISEIRTRVSQEAIAMSIPAVPFKQALEKLFRRPASSPPPSDAPRPSRPLARDSILNEALERVRRLNPMDKGKS